MPESKTPKRLEWDKTGEKTYETGVRMCVLYPQDITGKYPEGVAWNGLTKISEKPSGGEATSLWANDAKYLDLMSTEEFAASMEAYTYPDEFMKCDGSDSLMNGVYIGQQNRQTFGLCYRTVYGNDVLGNDYAYKLHFIYGCKASPSEKSYGTINDSPEANTLSWELKASPVPVTGKKPTASLVIDSSQFATEELKAKLTALEDIIYGTDSAFARLPLPNEILAILSGEATS